MSSKAEREARERFEEAGWFVVRAAGSLGGADLLLLRPRTDVDHGGVHHHIIEVKAAGRTRKDGVGVYYPSASGGKGERQWNQLRALGWWGLNCWFVVRQKGHLPEDVPRFAVHEVRGEAEPLHQDEGVPLTESELMQV